MFAYCGNNPVRRSDTQGTDWTDVLNEGLDVLELLVDTCESLGQKYDFCISQGFSGNARLAFFDDIQSISFVFDSKGNFAIQDQPFTKGITMGGAAAASIVSTTTVTFAPSYKNLEGMGYSIGESYFSNFYGLGGGLDTNFCEDKKTGKPYFGITASAGIGVPGYESHIVYGNTHTRFHINIFSLLRKQIKALREAIK